MRLGNLTSFNPPKRWLAPLTALALGPSLPWESMGGRRVRGGSRQAEERYEGGGGAAERVHQEIQQHHLTHCRTRLLQIQTSPSSSGFFSQSPFPLIRVHDVVRPLRKTSGGCMFGRRKFTEETGWLTRNRGLSQFLTNILSDRAIVGHLQLSLLTTEVKK